MNEIVLNKSKRVGRVVYIVEGEITEFKLLERIFSKIFDYDIFI